MAGLTWIKLNIDVFDNRKIKYLRTLPDGDKIVLIWVMLLTIAGRCNAGGRIFLTEDVPYTPNMLADELGFDVNTVNLAAEQMKKLDMIYYDESIFIINGWEEYQNAQKLDEIREKTRIRVANYRERQKALAERNACNVTCNVTESVTVTQCNALEEDIRYKSKDKNIYKDNNNITVSSDTVCRTKDVRRIVEAWNSLGLQQLQKVTSDSKRGGMLRARVNEYGVDAVLKAIENIRESPYLKGQGSHGWVITFEWFVKPNNFIKVYENSYREVRKNGANESVSEKGHGNVPQSRWGPSEYKYDN